MFTGEYTVLRTLPFRTLQAKSKDSCKNVPVGSLGTQIVFLVCGGGRGEPFRSCLVAICRLRADVPRIVARSR
jgi:hypothetical protein